MREYFPVQSSRMEQLHKIDAIVNRRDDGKQIIPLHSFLYILSHMKQNEEREIAIATMYSVLPESILIWIVFRSR